MRPHAKVLVLLGTMIAAANGVTAPGAPPQPAFAGWVRSSACPVLIRTGKTGTSKQVAAAQAEFLKLYVGQWIEAKGPGNATLIQFGRQFSLGPKQGWYEIRADSKKLPPGWNVYAGYTSRAGLARGQGPSVETLWRVLSLIDLQNPNPHAQPKIQMKIVPVTADGKPRPMRTDREGRYDLKVNDVVAVEISNPSNLPLYVNLLDIDCAGNVTRLLPQPPTQFVVPPKTKKIRFPALFNAVLPDGWAAGIEHFKLIASVNPIDLSVLATDDQARLHVVVAPKSDPLTYLILAAGGKLATAKPGHWTTADADFEIHLDL